MYSGKSIHASSEQAPNSKQAPNTLTSLCARITTRATTTAGHALSWEGTSLWTTDEFHLEFHEHLFSHHFSPDVALQWSAVVYCLMHCWFTGLFTFKNVRMIDSYVYNSRTSFYFRPKVYAAFVHLFLVEKFISFKGLPNVFHYRLAKLD